MTREVRDIIIGLAGALLVAWFLYQSIGYPMFRVDLPLVEPVLLLAVGVLLIGGLLYDWLIPKVRVWRGRDRDG